MEHAAETGNVALTCRTFGICRKTFYEWQDVAERYRLEALMPKARRRRQLPNATPTHVLHELLAIGVTEPTLGCRQFADRLADRGYVVSKTTVQKLLVNHGMGRRHQRVARAAALAALVSGLVTEPVAEDLFGFCRWASQPGELMAVDSFYIGNLNGVGKLYQLTAIDTATRWVMIQIVLGPVTAATPADSSIRCSAGGGRWAGRSEPCSATFKLRTASWVRGSSGRRREDRRRPALVRRRC